MKRKPYTKYIIVILLIVPLLSFALLFAGCTGRKNEEKINVYDYESIEFSYAETKGSEVYKEYKGLYVATDNAEYYFEHTVGNIRRNEFVTYSENIFEKLGIDAPALKIYVSVDFYTRAESEYKCVYFHPDDRKTVKHIIFLLQALSSETANYGLLQGISGLVYDDLNWPKLLLKSNEQIKAFLDIKDNQFILDLNYAVFNRKFATQNQITFAENVSYKLAEFIKNNYGIAVIKDLFAKAMVMDIAFENTFYGYLNLYLNSVNAPMRPDSPVILRSSSFTYTCPIRFYTVSCDYYIDRNWMETNIQQSYYAYTDFVLNYSSLKEFLTAAEISYEKIRIFFGFETPPWVTDVFMYNKENGIVGLQQWLHRIDSRSLTPLPQGYAYIMNYYYGTIGSWLLDAIPGYLMVNFDTYFINDFKYLCENYKDLNLEETEYFAIDYYVNLGREFDVSEFMDCIVYLSVFHFGSENIYPESNFTFAVCFSDYLIKTYGVEKCIELYCSGSHYINVYGKTQDALIGEYLDSIEVLFDNSDN